MRKRDRWNIDTIDLTTQRQQPEQKKDESRVVGFIKCHWKHALIILGVLASMRYYYDEDGTRRLYRLTFSDMQLQDDYDVLTEQLDDVRKLMVDVAIVDIHLANGKYTNYEAATLYTSILDDKLDVISPARFRTNGVELKELGDYKVVYGDCDENIHLNNTNYPRIYAGFIPDMLGKRIKHLSINYHHEARLGASFKVYGGENDGALLFKTMLEDGNVGSEARIVLGDIEK